MTNMNEVAAPEVVSYEEYVGRRAAAVRAVHELENGWSANWKARHKGVVEDAKKFLWEAVQLNGGEYRVEPHVRGIDVLKEAAGHLAYGFEVSVDIDVLILKEEEDGGFTLTLF